MIGLLCGLAFAANAEMVARAGEPFLAYPGDLVILSAQGSAGPEGVELEARWTQVEGPSAALSSTTAWEPEFTPQRPGVYVFELWVGAGEQWSIPDRSQVIVIDRSAGPYSPGGCAGGGGGLALLALPLFARRRRTT